MPSLRRRRASGRSYADAVLASPGLVGFWRLGEKSGTVAQALVGPNGSYVASPTLGVQMGASDGDTGVTFNGSTQDVLIGTNAVLSMATALTILARVRRSGAPAGDERIFARRAGSNLGYDLAISLTTGVLTLFCSDGTNSVSGGGGKNVCDGAVHQVGATRQGNALVTYVDAVIDLSDPAKYVSVGSMAGSANAAIGKLEDLGVGFLTGSIKDVAVWNRALAPGEVADLYGAR